MNKEFLWVEKYRPKTIDECILPNNLKTIFKDVVATGEIKNMILTGTSGLGKTTVARAICNQLGVDYILINASESRNIDTLRGEIKQFASTVSLAGGYKVVILDEADHLNPGSFQPALRAFMEEFSSNCRFILTCNHKNKIIEAIHSRCAVFEFNVSKKALPKLQAKFAKRMMEILEAENVSYDTGALMALIARLSPDWRRVIGECHNHSVGGELLLDPEGRATAKNIEELYGYLREKNFKSMRTWVAENVDTDPSFILRAIYDTMYDHVKRESVPQLVLILADYGYKQAFVVDQEINMVACFTEVMASVELK